MHHGRAAVHKHQSPQEPLGPLKGAPHLFHVEGDLRLHRLLGGTLVLPYPVDEVLGLFLGHQVEDGGRQDDDGTYSEEYEPTGERVGAHAQDADLDLRRNNPADGLTR